jgi:KDO2-lipid IV(A) lauroyltransferase
LAQTKNRFQAWAEYALATALIGTLRVLPRSAADLVGRMATRLLDFAVPKLRSVGLKNLSFAFSEIDVEEHHRILDGVFASIARMLVALARFPSLNATNIGQWISYEGLENYLQAKQAGRGILIATAHLGNWELSAFAHAWMTEPMNVMVRPLDNPLIDRIVEQRRTLSGNHLIYKKDAARAVISALRGNEAVGILIDQNTSAPEGVFINFFGRLACVGTAFVKLAQHTKAPVIPGFALWEKTKKRYVLRFYPAVEITGDLLADTQRIHSVFEQIIRQYPDQWMWIHRRWKTRPPGESALY